MEYKYTYLPKQVFKFYLTLFGWDGGYNPKLLCFQSAQNSVSWSGCECPTVQVLIQVQVQVQTETS